MTARKSTTGQVTPLSPYFGEFDEIDRRIQDIQRRLTEIETSRAAAAQIAEAIMWFRLCEDSDHAYQPQSTKDALEQAQKLGKAFVAAVDAFDGQAVAALLAARRSPSGSHPALYPTALLREIEVMKGKIDQFTVWVDAAVEGIPPKPTRDASNLKWFVERFDNILTRHGPVRLSRSNKGKTNGLLFVAEVVNIAFPGVFRPGSIDEAVKAAIRKRKSKSKSTAVVNLGTETAP